MTPLCPRCNQPVCFIRDLNGEYIALNNEIEVRTVIRLLDAPRDDGTRAYCGYADTFTRHADTCPAKVAP